MGWRLGSIIQSRWKARYRKNLIFTRRKEALDEDEITMKTHRHDTTDPSSCPVRYLRTGSTIIWILSPGS
jgi:hypothetical protein